MDLQWFGVLVPVLLAWTGLLVGAIRWLLASYHGSLETRLAGIDALAAKEQARALELERRLAQDFVRREDCLRCHQGLEAQLARLHDSIDTLLQELARRPGRP